MSKLLSDQLSERQLAVIRRELRAALARNARDDGAGSVVEFGCYVGTAAVFMQRELVAEGAGRQLHLYDSFAGLPEKSAADESPLGRDFQAGALLTSKQTLIANFKKAGLPPPRIHTGWFEELPPNMVPGHIAFAFLDGDFYSSILTSLKLVWPRLSDGAGVVVDDYANPALPGARRAVDEWLITHPATLRVEAAMALIKYL